MAGVSREETVKVPAPEHERAVKDVRADGPYPALGERVSLRRRDRGGDDPGTLRWNIVSNERVNLESRSRMRKRTPVRSPCVM